MGIYEKKLAELGELCERLKNFNGYGLSIEKFKEFHINGNRLGYENEYFSRRACLMARGTDAIVRGDGVGDTKLFEILDAICSEFTWALPAHLDRDTKTPEKVIDLFSAETAQALCELMRYVKLPSEYCERIRGLVYDRIIEPFENNEFWWEKSAHNWAAVCSGSVGMVYLYEFPERFPSVRDRILGAMDCFLSGYGDDGACLEGLGYWAYGFGYFVYFAELLRRFDGIDLLSGKKTARIAEFNQHMFMKNGSAVSFSDGLRNGSFNIGLLCFLKREYGDRIEIPDLKYRADYDECYRFAPYLRSFLWFDEKVCEPQTNSAGEKYFADAQWYVNKKDKFAFAAKGGNNAEPHNHNDVGAFIIADDMEQLICDFGAGEYTREYFRDDSRYDYFCASSKGHSVPIIGGEFQKNGADFSAEIIQAGDGVFELDISKAYGIEKLTRLNREFKITDNGVLLRDTFEYEGNTITERLVSLAEPKIINGDTKIKNMTIKSSAVPTVGCETIKNHSGEDKKVYTLDYEADSAEFWCEFIFS